MDSLLADLTVSMSDFKKNPAKILREAGNKPVAVLNHNKTAFYMIEPSLYEALLENAYDREIETLVKTRRAQRSEAIEVDVEEI
jgi:antitoxin StbD